MIYSLGTFGFWGAWLSDKPVYYENEFAYDHMTNLYRDGPPRTCMPDSACVHTLCATRCSESGAALCRSHQGDCGGLLSFVLDERDQQTVDLQVE